MRFGPLVIERNRPAERGDVTLQEIVDQYDVVGVEPSHIVVADRSIALGDVPTGEIGSSNPPTLTGTSNYGSIAREEYNSQLRGLEGLKKYDQMRRSDAQVRTSLRILKTPVLAGRWYMEPSSDSKRDRMIADFVWENLTKSMSVSWPQLLTEILLFADYGFYAFEKVFTVRDGKIAWQKFSPRHPMDLWEWKLDSHGGPVGAWFYGPEGASDAVFIPIEKLLIFTFDKEGGDLSGISVLRSAYKHWYYKENLYKIDAIQKERHGIGIPIIKLPVGFKDEDKRAADELGRNLRTNEKAHVTLPPNWDIMFAKLEGQPVNCMESIQHHDEMIQANVLASFSGGPDDKNQTFLKGVRYVAEVVRDVFNHYAVPQLVEFNWGPKVTPPELRVRRIGDTVDWRTISFAMRNFIGAGILTPDERLEAWVRDEMDMPKPDPATARQVAKPQKVDVVSGVGDNQNPGGAAAATPGVGTAGAPQPPRVGPPRQSTAAGSQQGKNTGSNGRVGRDGSGG